MSKSQQQTSATSPGSQTLTTQSFLAMDLSSSMIFPLKPSNEIKLPSGKGYMAKPGVQNADGTDGDLLFSLPRSCCPYGVNEKTDPQTGRVTRQLGVQLYSRAGATDEQRLVVNKIGEVVEVCKRWILTENVLTHVRKFTTDKHGAKKFTVTDETLNIKAVSWPTNDDGSLDESRPPTMYLKLMDEEKTATQFFDMAQNPPVPVDYRSLVGKNIDIEPIVKLDKIWFGANITVQFRLFAGAVHPPSASPSAAPAASDAMSLEAFLACDPRVEVNNKMPRLPTEVRSGVKGFSAKPTSAFAFQLPRSSTWGLDEKFDNDTGRSQGKQVGLQLYSRSPTDLQRRVVAKIEEVVEACKDWILNPAVLTQARKFTTDKNGNKKFTVTRDTLNMAPIYWPKGADGTRDESRSPTMYLKLLEKGTYTNERTKEVVEGGVLTKFFDGANGGTSTVLDYTSLFGQRFDLQPTVVLDKIWFGATISVQFRLLEGRVWVQPAAEAQRSVLLPWLAPFEVAGKKRDAEIDSESEPAAKKLRSAKEEEEEEAEGEGEGDEVGDEEEGEEEEEEEEEEEGDE